LPSTSVEGVIRSSLAKNSAKSKRQECGAPLGQKGFRGEELQAWQLIKVDARINQKLTLS
jgi:hypothetical protein